MKGKPELRAFYETLCSKFTTLRTHAQFIMVNLTRTPKFITQRPWRWMATERCRHCTVKASWVKQESMWCLIISTCGR